MAVALRRSATEQVERRTLRERRRHVWRSVLLFMVVTAAMGLVSLLNRDEAAIRACREHMEEAIEALQRNYDEGLKMPVLVALPREPGTPQDEWQQRLRFDHVRYNALYAPSSTTSGRVGVCCCKWPHSRLIGSTGRYVIVFDSSSRRYELRWFSETEFARQAERLGLADPTRP